MAIESPPMSISTAEPSTTSSAAAVITSRALARASRRNSGFSAQSPTTTSPARAATPCATASQRELPSAPGTTGAMKATSASSGTISRSSNSRIDTMRCPRGRAMSPRSPNNCMTMAVDVSTKPAAPRKATGGASPKPSRMPVITAVTSPTCSAPRPKIWPRSCQRWDGRISRPMMKRNITTPSSATCRMAAGSVNRPRPNGPTASPAAR